MFAMNSFFIRRSDRGWVSDLGERHAGELYVPRPEDQDEADGWLASIKTAAVLMLWVRETPDNTMYQKFDIYPGDLRNRVELAQWLLYSAHELAKLWDSPAVPSIDDAMRRVRYGVLPELLDLCRLEQKLLRLFCCPIYLPCLSPDAQWREVHDCPLESNRLIIN